MGGRWVDHNKGEFLNPSVRSRYVAKDIAFWKGDAMFAATPPLGALRVLLSNLAASGRARACGRRPGARKALLIDVRKAHPACS
eukprot:4352988-Alexandrium_andersonii.AAC.1